MRLNDNLDREVILCRQEFEHSAISQAGFYSHPIPTEVAPLVFYTSTVESPITMINVDLAAELFNMLQWCHYSSFTVKSGDHI